MRSRQEGGHGLGGRCPRLGLGESHGDGRREIPGRDLVGFGDRFVTSGPPGRPRAARMAWARGDLSGRVHPERAARPLSRGQKRAAVGAVKAITGTPRVSSTS